MTYTFDLELYRINKQTHTSGPTRRTINPFRDDLMWLLDSWKIVNTDGMFSLLEGFSYRAHLYGRPPIERRYNAEIVYPAGDNTPPVPVALLPGGKVKCTAAGEDRVAEMLVQRARRAGAELRLGNTACAAYWANQPKSRHYMADDGELEYHRVDDGDGVLVSLLSAPLENGKRPASRRLTALEAASELALPDEYPSTWGIMVGNREYFWMAMRALPYGGIGNYLKALAVNQLKRGGADVIYMGRKSEQETIARTVFMVSSPAVEAAVVLYCNEHNLSPHEYFRALIWEDCARVTPNF